MENWLNTATRDEIESRIISAYGLQQVDVEPFKTIIADIVELQESRKGNIKMLHACQEMGKKAEISFHVLAKQIVNDDFKRIIKNLENEGMTNESEYLDKIYKKLVQPK